ncbi:hypothetical protein VWN77_10290, partial [Campylobacter coli]
ANWRSPGRWSIEIMTNNYRLIFKPLEKLFIQKKGEISIYSYDGDKLWQFNDFDFDEFKIIAIELVRDEYENLNFGNHMHFNAKNQ